MQLNLTDYEAQLLEQRLRGRTVSFSDADYLAITAIADRLLAREVGTDVISVDRHDGTHRFKGTTHTTRRETDEYACSCGARWDVSDGDTHPR